MFLKEALHEFDLAMMGEDTDPTRDWYQRSLKSLVQFLGNVKVDTITTSDLRRWRASLLNQESRWSDHPTRPETKGKLSLNTVASRITALRGFFSWLVDEGVLDSNPAARIKPPGLATVTPKAADPEDILAMIEVADTRDEALIRFLADTGCRVGGLCRLTVKELDLAQGQATVYEKYRGGVKDRKVYLSDETVAALRDWLAIRPQEYDDRVFIGRQGPLSPTGVYQALERLAKRAGIQGRYNPHAFRHCWAREALKSGADLATVSQILGHSSIRVTHQFYARWSKDELGERHNRFSWLNSVEH